MTRLQLPAGMYQEIVQHAQEELPRECCGLISGKDGEPMRLFRLTNVEAGNRLYRIDDDELYAVMRELDEVGEEIFAIYHSHPETPAYPSATDVDLAFWDEAHYVICSLADPARTSMRAFRIADGAITETGIELV